PTARVEWRRAVSVVASWCPSRASTCADRSRADDDLDAAIVGAVLGRLVVDDRPGRAHAHRADLLGGDPTRDQVVAYGISSVQRQRLVDLVRTLTVGVTF